MRARCLLLCLEGALCTWDGVIITMEQSGSGPQMGTPMLPSLLRSHTKMMTYGPATGGRRNMLMNMLIKTGGEKVISGRRSQTVRWRSADDPVGPTPLLTSVLPPGKNGQRACCDPSTECMSTYSQQKRCPTCFSLSCCLGAVLPTPHARAMLLGGDSRMV